jgi:antibiotic biosynthesis monooxygenase (ABM) superfamily enzyme
MYGTIARMKLKPGAEAEMTRMIRDTAPEIPGFAFQHIYKLDAGSNEYMIVIGFETKEAYVANAKSPEQNERYEQYVSLLEEPPEWNDGEIVSSLPA